MFCPKCLATHLNTIDDFCPACHLNNKDFPDLPKNMRFLMAPIKVRCDGCSETPGLFKVNAHYPECVEKCTQCKRKCAECNAFTFMYKKHICGEEPANPN